MAYSASNSGLRGCMEPGELGLEGQPGQSSEGLAVFLKVFLKQLPRKLSMDCGCSRSYTSILSAQLFLH